MKTSFSQALRARSPVWRLAWPVTLLFVLCGVAWGQAIEKQTPANGGSTMTWERGSLTMTIGQPAADRFVNAAVEIHGGFLPPTRSPNGVAGAPLHPGLRVEPRTERGELRVDLPWLPSLSMALYDLNGRLHHLARNVAGSITVDLADIPTGLYFLRVYRGADVVQSQLITVIR